ncbi:conserved hypothetical protein [Ricinus communis]|uniref:Uncharacterized protein n=1 Tax=Ricinus communis TaxID=3988 RepID=B9RVB4_RICCO|nr:conserved hypothetical protein [Ricinus communis]
MKTLTKLVSRSMAESLNLEEDYFLNQFNEQAAPDARFRYIVILRDEDKNWITVPTVSDFPNPNG